MLLPATDGAAAAAIGERLREAVADVPSFHGTDGHLRLTISVGVASATTNDVAQSLVARADAALYRAKGAGRNTVAA